MRLASALALALLAAGSRTALAQAGGVPAPAPVQASHVQVAPLQFRERTLANGLKVYSALDRTTPNVSVQVWYDVGGKDDPEHRSGFAHLFEHMMFKATRDMPSEYLDRLTEDVGGANNASTADDATNYYEVIPANHLERLLWAEAERMSSLKVDQAAFASERAVVEEELRQRVLADPYGRLQSLLVPENSYRVHPYRRPVIGSIEDLDAATLSDVQAFHATYYRPDNANLIVVGNFDPAKLDAAVDRYFGDIRHPGAAIPRVTAVEPPRTHPVEVTGYGPNVPLPALALTYAIPAGSSADGPALAVMDALLTTGRSSRLYRDLVYQGQIAQDVFSSLDLRQQPGLYEVGMILAGGHAPGEGETAVLAELTRLRDAPAAPSELARAKNQLVAQVLRERETVEGRGSALGHAIIVEGGAERVNQDVAAIQAVSAADVQRVARLYLDPQTRVAIRYLPESARPPGQPARAPSPASLPVAAVAPTVAQSLPPPESLPHAPPAPGPIVAPTPIHPATLTLPNGLEVVVAPTAGAPLVTAELLVRSGASSDPQGLEGVASLTAALLTEGAGGRSAPELAEAVEALGGSLESQGGTDGSQATLTVLADQVGAVLPILADAAIRPAFAPDELERLRRQRLDALQLQMDEPGALARMAVRRTVFGASSPYGHDPQGTPASLRRIDRSAVLGQYRRTYRPDNAVLVLTGDITPERGFALARAAFGAWVRPAGPPPVAPAPSPTPPPRVVVIDLPGTGQAAVAAAGPSIARADGRFYAAEVASAVLGGGFSSRLNEELRIKRGLSYGASCNIDEFRATGLFVASAQTKNTTAVEAAQLMRAEIARLSASPIPSAELEVREASLVGEFGRQTATSSGLAGQIGSNYALYGLDAGEIGRFTPRMDAVTAAAARDAAAQAIDPSKMSLVIAGDAQAFLPALKRLYPDVEVMKAQDLAR